MTQKEPSSTSYFFQGLLNIGLLPFTFSWSVIKFIIEFIWAICVSVFCFFAGIILAPIWIIRAIGGDPKVTQESYSNVIYKLMRFLHQDTADFFIHTVGFHSFNFGKEYVYKLGVFCISLTILIFGFFSLTARCNEWDAQRQEQARLEQIRKEEERKKIEKEHPVITTGVKTLKYIFGDK